MPENIDTSTLEGRDAERDAEIVKIKRLKRIGDPEFRLFTDGVEYISWINLGLGALLAAGMVLDLTLTGGSVSTLFASTFGAPILKEAISWTVLALVTRGIAGYVRGAKISAVQVEGIMDNFSHPPQENAW